MPVQYSFTTVWNIPAPIGRVWDAVYNSQDWPLWWKDFQAVTEIRKGNNQDIGTIRRFKLKSPFDYTLKFDLELTEYEKYQYLTGTAWGDLEGSGVWEFRQKDKFTVTTCKWDVSTNIAWMNVLAFLLKPFFEFNHRKVMANGEQALVKYLTETQ
jgi:uncharacterized protein YndB with AHSA1/START domain